MSVTIPIATVASVMLVLFLLGLNSLPAYTVWDDFKASRDFRRAFRNSLDIVVPVAILDAIIVFFLLITTETVILV